MYKRQELVRQEAERTRLKQERGELYDELHRQEVACARAEAQLKAVEDECASHAQSVQRVRAERERLCLLYTSRLCPVRAESMLIRLETPGLFSGSKRTSASQSVTARRSFLRIMSAGSRMAM